MHNALRKKTFRVPMMRNQIKSEAEISVDRHFL